MSDDNHDRPRPKRWVIFLALPVIYVLSFGPVSWFIGRYFDVIQASPMAQNLVIGLDYFYLPLQRAAGRSVWFEECLEWYVGLF